MIKKILFTFIFAIFLVLPVLATQVELIDKNEDACMQKAISTADMLKCTTIANTAWDKEMNKYYKLLMKKLPTAQKNDLLKAQKSWLLFRDNDASFVNNSIRDSRQGTMYINIAGGERRELVKQRAIQLRNYYQIISE